MKFIHTKISSGMVTAMDEAIGEVVQALTDTNQFTNTILIFSSDVSSYSSQG